jgi:MoaA/NifB/PqqE/SkfB family radical SAM enzyme
MIKTLSEAEQFRTFGIPNEKNSLPRFLKRRLSIDDTSFNAIVKYLKDREDEIQGKQIFGIVYDITRFCNLQCAHCCVNAIFSKDKTHPKFETTTDEVFTILQKVYDYTSARKFPNVFIIFGGGEPTLRPDFAEIAKFACNLFGQEGVGVNSNGTTLTIEKLYELSPYFGFVEVSIDGFEAYHNAWRDPHQVSNITSPYQKSLDLILESVKVPELAQKLEVSSAVTTENISDLRVFTKYLDSLGVRNYSIHRAMPVGRMGLRFDKIPSMEMYAQLFLDIAWLRNNTSFNVLHLHHSLESIYSVLFLGYDIHASNLLTGSARHSIGLDPYGNVYFDPWCVVSPFDKLSAGNLLKTEQSLGEIIETEGSLIKLADEITKCDIRCRGCRMKCSGGMRMNALGHFLYTRFGHSIYSAQITDLVAGLSEIDPACPFYEP